MNEEFVFVGNRRFVLEEMHKLEVNIVKAIIIKNSHLEVDFLAGNLPENINYVFINNKSELIKCLNSTNYNTLIANGCPFILPLERLKKAKYVNIHPSYLPDLRGVDPVIGSILFMRDAGATCHVMDNTVDTGDIISQVRIPFSDDLDVVTLYQLSFVAERQVFNKSLNVNFKPASAQINTKELIEYKRNESDWTINFKDSNNKIIQMIKAFNNASQGCRFFIKGQEFKVFLAQKMENPYLKEIVFNFEEGEVALSYEASVIFHKDGEVLRFSNILSKNRELNIMQGEFLF
jgi:methionyl-tRNA formyltransferase